MTVDMYHRLVYVSQGDWTGQPKSVYIPRPYSYVYNIVHQSVPETKCNSVCNQWMDIQRPKNQSVWDHTHVLAVSNHTSHMSIAVASEAYHDWSGEAADAQLRVNFTLKLLLSQNFCNRPLMRFITFASNIGPAAAVPAGPAPSPLYRL